jgi:hypothetical protein
MTERSVAREEARVAAALAELTALIRVHYPDASFAAVPGDDPTGVYLITTVDVDDPDAVTDLVIEHTLRLQLDEGLPVYVIPIRPIGRVIEKRRRRVVVQRKPFLLRRSRVIAGRGRVL